MVENIVDKFIDQLKTDTINKVIAWTNLELVPEGYDKLSANLPAILFNHAHSMVVKKMSYRTDDDSFGNIYLIVRHSTSGKNGITSKDYHLYVQKDNKSDCLPVSASRSSLVELATIIRNISSTQTETTEQQVENFINNYLKTACK